MLTKAEVPRPLLIYGFAANSLKSCELHRLARNNNLDVAGATK
jgi:hypothetical protein